MLQFICLLCNVFLCNVFTFNIDTKNSFQVYSVADKNLQFGYTVNFLGSDRLIVGAPPIKQSDSGMNTGGVYSCDIESEICKKITGDPNPLVPTSKSRCFLPPYNIPCEDAGSSQTAFWFYDPLHTVCKTFKPACKKQVAQQNIFANKKSCLETCNQELANRISAASQTGRASHCSVTFQNLHAGVVKLLQKDYRGQSLNYYRMYKGEVRALGRWDYDSQVCGIPLVAKSGKTSEYLYFINIADNSFDAVFIPRDGVTVSIGTMEQIRMIFYGSNTPKMGLSVHTFLDQVISCEPQYNRKYVGPVGRCSTYSNESLRYNVFPFEDKLRDRWQWWEYGTSVGGFTTTTIPGAPSLFFASAPNARRGIGSIAALSFSNGKILGSELNPIINTEAEAYLGKDSYFGYSLSAGRLEESGPDSAIEGKVSGNIVSGSPRGGIKREGYLLIIRFSESSEMKFQVMQRLEDPDELIGSYFGSSTCVVDLNSDERDDVLVGSPYFTKVRDEGKVYVYMNRKGRGRNKGGFAGVELKFTLEGNLVPGGRFGSTITSIGDINKDGYNDVAIGAPGDERGAVYIFNGNHQGVNPKYSQIIDESHIPNLPKGFGVSISGGSDVNGDSYGDIAVGGLGGSAYIFKSRPVITIKRRQSVNTSRIPYKSESANCRGPDNEMYYCVKVVTLISYTGVGVPDTYSVEITHKMDVGKLSKRAKILEADSLVSKRTYKVMLQKGVEKVLSDIVYVKVEQYGAKMDLFTPIRQVTSYRESDSTQVCGMKKLCPILPEVEDTSTALSYMIKCSNASFCKPYLRVTMDLQVQPATESRTSEIIYGVTKRIIVTTRVNNTGETAYQPKLLLRFLSDMEVNTAELADRSLEWEISDIKQEGGSEGNDRELSIVLPSISPNTQLSVVVEFSLAKRKPTTILPYTFIATATALDIEKTPQHHNIARVSTSVAIETCKHIKQASADPTPILYNPLTKSKEDGWTIDDAENVLFSYYVRNSGKVTLDSLLVNISLVDELFGNRFMCVQSIIVDQVQCKDFINCNGFLQRQNGKKQKKGEGKDKHFVSAKCHIRSIEVGRGATIRIRAAYFADALGKLPTEELGEKNITFTPIVSISHDDPFSTMEYQRADCPRDKTATVTFIKVQPRVKEDVPLWTYIISVIAALFLLLCIIMILKKNGFFEKNIKGISAPLTDYENGDVDDDDEEEEL